MSILQKIVEAIKEEAAVSSNESNQKSASSSVSKSSSSLFTSPDGTGIAGVLFFSFIGFMFCFLFGALFYLKYFISTGDNGLYIDRTGERVKHGKLHFKIKNYWHFYVSRFFTSKDLDLDYVKSKAASNCNKKYQLLRSNIEQEVTTYFHVSSNYHLNDVHRLIENKDYKGKKSYFTNTPEDYISPKKLIKLFLKFLPHNKIKELNSLATTLNNENIKNLDLDLEKNDPIFEMFLNENEKCGICLDSVYLPKNETTNKYEPIYSCIKLMCGHKFHLDCFLKNTYKSIENEEIGLTDEGILFQATTENPNSLLYRANDRADIDQKYAILEHREKLKKQLLERADSFNKKQNIQIPDISKPNPVKILKHDIKCKINSDLEDQEIDNTPSNITAPPVNRVIYNQNVIEYNNQNNNDNNDVIAKTLNSRVNRKMHCTFCRLDVELVLAYIKNNKCKMSKCAII
ncbi:hypothetical protein ACO0SA_004534 [Hanseniaspora valbyensis]